MDLCIVLFMCWCITNIIVNGTILDSIRNWLLIKIPFIGNLISCMMCSGLWVGLFIYPVIIYKSNLYIILFNNMLIDWLAFSLFSSGASVIINSLMIYFLKKTNSNDK